MTQCVHWAFSYIASGLLCPIFPLGHPWPICFPWPSSALFLILLSHGLLLTLLGFPGPITLSLILEAHGLSISPLLSLFALLRAYRGLFSFFYILPMGLLLSFSLGSFRPICFLRDHFMGPWSIYSCHFDLMAFLLIDSVLPMLLGFSSPTRLPKWASTHTKRDIMYKNFCIVMTYRKYSWNI